MTHKDRINGVAFVMIEAMIKACQLAGLDPRHSTAVCQRAKEICQETLDEMGVKDNNNN